mmetsp:Transcript_17768/g.41373  ORF Transcript_17768/g.41373 Transcript_17768/m.41373 type:complete len:442 (+) Transcript_17768:75-1400(+)
MAAPQQFLRTEQADPLAAAAAEEYARKCRREFLLMSVTFGINHAAVTTPILFASSVLTNTAGQGSNAVLYGMTLLVSLFMSSLLYSWFGAKRGLSISMLLYAIYVAMFAWSSDLCDEEDPNGSCTQGDAMQLPVALAAAFVGGCGAGLLWTCQGGFFAHISEELATAEAKPKDVITAQLSGTFATIFLSMECAMRALTTLLTNRNFHIGLTYPVVFALMSGLALIATMAFQVLATSMDAKQVPTRVCTKVLAAVELWKDPKLWLLQTTNLTFGFAAAWYGGWVNRNIVSKALNPTFIGFLGAVLSGLAAALSWAFGHVATRCGKGPVILLGSLAFLSLGIGSKLVHHPDDWSWGVLIFPCFMGIGRAVYESTNKAIFADFFPGPKSPGAFANVFVFGTGASTTAFVLGSTSSGKYEFYLLVAFAALTFPCYFLARTITSST